MTIARRTRFASAALAMILAAALASGPSSAAGPAPAGGSGGAPKPIGTFKDWIAYTMQDQNRTVCFIVSEPKSKSLSPAKAQRGDPFFLITRWAPTQAAQPSIIMGYPQASDTKTKIKIGDQSFEMFVDGDGAWMESEAGDKKLTEAMRKGSTMTISGQSTRGTKSVDRYSLAGISSALDKIASECK